MRAASAMCCHSSISEQPSSCAAASADRDGVGFRSPDPVARRLAGGCA